jgi:uracil-DNA glycosylase family 4
VPQRQFNVRGAPASPNCVNCPCAKNGQPNKAVRSFGSPGGFCIVGEGPGGEELLQGYPFVGASGKVVNKGLKLANVDRGFVWITNATLCRRPASDEDLAFAVECCRPRLQADLALGSPTAILALGGTAMRALQLPVTYVAQARGTVQRSPLAPNVPVIGSIHPAAILRGGAGEITAGGKQKMNVDAQATFLFADIGKAARIADGSLSPEWADDITVVHEASEVRTVMQAILNDIYEDGLLGLDLEWSCEGSKNALDALGAGAWRALISFVGVGCTQRAVSFTWDSLLNDHNFHCTADTSNLPSGLEMLQAAMEDSNLPKLCHNKQADKAVWEAHVGQIRGPRVEGMPFERHLDSMLLHHAACPGADHDLQQTASQFLCVPPWKVDHARAVAEHKEQIRVEAKESREIEKARKKIERMAAHEARNAALKADKAARRAARQLKLKGVD